MAAKTVKSRIMKTLGCVLTFAVIVLLVLVFGYFLDPKYAQDGIDVVKAFEQLEDDSLDVIVYGSSRAWKGVDTGVMYKDYGLEAYNYSANWLSLNTTLLFLQNSLKSQKPKVACIETGLVDQIEKDVDLDGQIYCTRYMRASKEKREFLKTCFGNNPERYLSYYFPLIMFHDNWSSISKENFIKPDTERFINSRGFYSTNGSEPFDAPDYLNFVQEDLSAESIETLDEMVSVCKANNIHVIFFTCPYADQYHYSDALKKYSEKNGCDYINLFEYTDEMGLDFSEDLKDSGHLNDKGAAKTASFLAKYIMEKYSIE